MGIINSKTLSVLKNSRPTGKAMTPNTKTCAKCHFVVPTALNACEHCGTSVSVAPIDDHSFVLR